MKQKFSVVSGKQRGRKIGLPTINCRVPKDFPYDHGIYAGWIYLGNKKRVAAIHFGPRPVFDEQDVSLEIHVLETVVNGVSDTVELEMSKRIRDIKKFSSVDILLKQIEKDIKEIKKILDV